MLLDLPARWESLINFVHQALCEQENLIPEQFPLQIAGICRGGRFCGVEFMLFGPRQIRLNAILASETNQLYLYNARGERFQHFALPEPVAEIPREFLACDRQ